LGRSSGASNQRRLKRVKPRIIVKKKGRAEYEEGKRYQSIISATDTKKKKRPRNVMRGAKTP